jgi:hypothetical protein
MSRLPVKRMIPPAMQRVLAALMGGCYLEWQKVSKAENGNGRRLFIVDPHHGRQGAVDPRTALALRRRGYIMHPADAGYLGQFNPHRWELTALGDLDYRAEVGAR